LGIIYPSGLKVNYQYTGGQVSAVLINGKPHLSQIKYNASGVLIGGVLANGELLKRTYDTSGNPTGTALAKYTLDAAGTIKSINTNNINNTNTTASIIPSANKNTNRQSSLLNQSSRVNTQAATTTNNTQTLTYGVGNRLNKNTTTRLVGTVANNTHQAIIIDAAGNIIFAAQMF
jgi:YD repeat-containing protein